MDAGRRPVAFRIFPSRYEPVANHLLMAVLKVGMREGESLPIRAPVTFGGRETASPISHCLRFREFRDSPFSKTKVDPPPTLRVISADAASSDKRT